jgi:hypothetical protein
MRKTNEDGQVYEELDGDERVQGDGEGDQKFILDECLTPAEIEQMLNKKSERRELPTAFALVAGSRRFGFRQQVNSTFNRKPCGAGFWLLIAVAAGLR